MQAICIGLKACLSFSVIFLMHFFPISISLALLLAYYCILPTPFTMVWVGVFVAAHALSSRGSMEPSSMSRVSPFLKSKAKTEKEIHF